MSTCAFFAVAPGGLGRHPRTAFLQIFCNSRCACALWTGGQFFKWSKPPIAFALEADVRCNQGAAGGGSSRSGSTFRKATGGPLSRLVCHTVQGCQPAHFAISFCAIFQMIQKAITIRQPFAWLIVRGFKPVENRSAHETRWMFAGPLPSTRPRHWCRIRSMTGAAKSWAGKSRGMSCTSAASSASLNYLKQVVQWAFCLGASERKSDTFPVVPRTVGTLDPTDAAAPPTGLGALRRDVCSLPFVPVRIF